MTLLATVTGLPLAIMTTDDSQLQQCLCDCHCSSCFNLKFNCANLNHDHSDSRACELAAADTDSSQCYDSERVDDDSDSWP